MTHSEEVLIAFVGLLLLAIASALFSGMETALFSIRQWQMERWRHEDRSSADLFERLMRDPRQVLSVILLSDTLVNTSLIVLAFYCANEGPEAIPKWVIALGLLAVIVIPCDLLPKTAAAAKPFRFAPFCLQILRYLLPALGPISRLLQSVSERSAALFLAQSPDPRTPLGDDELITLVELSAEEGQLRAEESEMIAEIIKLGNKSVKDCMTPRVDAFAIQDDLSNEEVIQELRLHRHEQVPVFGENPDQVLGILDAKRFLLDPTEPFAERLDPPSFVPETMRALDLLRAFLTHRQKLAIVVDEYGGTEGVITTNDIVEEILADVAPRADEALYLEAAGDQQWLASGSARLEDVGELLDIHFADDGVDTLSGFIFHRLGYVPKSGAKVEVAPLNVEILQSTRRRILEVLLRKTAVTESGEQ